MPGASDVQYGNEKFDIMLYIPSVTYPTLAANANGTNTLTVPGVLPLDCVSYNMVNPPAHLFLDNMYVSAANTITNLWSTDATGISTGTLALSLTVTRATNANLGASALPAAII